MAEGLTAEQERVSYQRPILAARDERLPSSRPTHATPCRPASAVPVGVDDVVAWPSASPRRECSTREPAHLRSYPPVSLLPSSAPHPARARPAHDARGGDDAPHHGAGCGFNPRH
jgi:hypothetical protein